MDIKSYLQIQVAERILVCDEKWNESIEIQVFVNENSNI